MEDSIITNPIIFVVIVEADKMRDEERMRLGGEDCGEWGLMKEWKG